MPDEPVPAGVVGIGGCLTTPLTATGIDQTAARQAVARAFAEQRAFPFVPHPDWNAAGRRRRAALTAAVRADAVAAATRSPTTADRLNRDAQLMGRLDAAVRLTHEAIASIGDSAGRSLGRRRFVLIRETAGSTCLYEEEERGVVARVGQGPLELRQPTIYLGLRLFDLLAAGQVERGAAAPPELVLILFLEERAIETGYSHVVSLDAASRGMLERLFGVLRRPVAGLTPAGPAPGPPRRPMRFGPAQRRAALRRLNARRADSPLDFDVAACVSAMRSLERIARRAKAYGGDAVRREVMRLLVAASGHDLDEVRNHASLLLERMLAPKEFAAPLARTFATVARGATHRFSFDLPRSRGRHRLRIYRGRGHRRFPSEADLDYVDLDLTGAAPGAPLTAAYRFDDLGHYDYCVTREHRNGRREWVPDAACNGRINVIPDLRGELVLQIFPDIHGHTRAYWADGKHPGMVYNEHGQIIRLGTFADIAAHLPHIKRRYGFTAIYVLGAQKRGGNREDWTRHATSPSPFAPESLTEMEPSLGGNDGLRALVAAAHELEMKVLVDVIPHLNRRVHDVPDTDLVRCFDEAGALVPRASTDGRYGSWNDGALLNYRRLSVWEWLADSVWSLIERFDVDGVRCDIAHALPIMMKRDNTPVLPSGPRSDEEQVEGTIVVNERVDDHYVTTGFFDSACRDLICSPLHYLLMREMERAAHAAGKGFYLHVAEAY